MTTNKEIAWARIFSEGFVIVISILLAFAIDAWWDDRTQRKQEQEHLLAMRDEFQASISGLEEVLASVELNAANIEALIVKLKSVEEGQSIEVEGTMLGSAIMWRTTDVSTSTLTALMRTRSRPCISRPVMIRKPTPA